MEVDIRNVKVMMGIPCKEGTTRLTTNSIAKTMYHAGKIGMDLRLGSSSASNNDRARDLVLDGFLASDCEKLFWIDSDIVWEPHDFFKIVAQSTLVDIVLASYPAKTDGPAPFFVDFDNPAKTNRHGLLKIKGAGFGFVCMDRKVVQAVADMSPEVYDQSIGRKRKKVFRHDIDESHLVDGAPCDRTEDFAFFADAMEAGFDIWLDPFIELGHVGQKEWRAKFADAVNIEYQPQPPMKRTA